MYGGRELPCIHVILEVAMAGFVDSTVKDIDARLSELREEVTRLEAARAALTGSGAGRRGPGRPRSSGARASSASRAGAGARAGAASRTASAASRRPGRPRGRRGGNTRAKEALELVRSRPGITIPEIAAELKILPNYLYRVMPRLVDEGQVRREGQGWHPAGG
jgi:hypothetical protein